jgi:hypothetical protein
VFRFKVNMIAVLTVCSVLGITYYLATGQVT